MSSDEQVLFGFFCVLPLVFISILILLGYAKVREDRRLKRLDEIKHEQELLHLPVQQALDRLHAHSERRPPKGDLAALAAHNNEYARLFDEHETALQLYLKQIGGPLWREEWELERSAPAPAMSEQDQQALFAASTMMAMGGMMMSDQGPFDT